MGKNINIGNYIFDKGLMFRIYKELLQPNNEKTNNPALKWAKTMDRPYSKGDIQTAKKHTNRSLASLIIRNIQIRATVRCHLHQLV